MKKSLVLAMAMALGVTASAYAANPFSDVPAGHWAYDSISKLAAAGIIEGYGDDTFRGDRLMTRYEMAQIVAKALAKGANVDKLAAEFADELDALGVRVAALEKKSDNVKITGQFRYHYAQQKHDNIKGHDNALRSRIWFTGQVNDNWNYVGMLQNVQDLTNNAGDEGTNFQRAYLEGRLGGTKVTAGRQDFTIVDANLYDDRMDGIKAEYGSKVKVLGFYGKPTNQYWGDTTVTYGGKNVKYDRFWGLHANADLGKFNLDAGYTKFFDGSEYTATGKKDYDKKYELEDNGVWHVGATYNFGEASLGAIYMRSDADFYYLGDEKASKDGFIITGTVKGAEASKPGSWGLIAKYYNQGAGTLVAHGMDGNALLFLDEGFKGWMAGGSVTLAKNMVGTVEYFDLKGKVSDIKSRTLWSQMVVTF